jgi:XTP/dITP diphosphohydrolase
VRIVLATGNRDKVAELGEMFPGVDVGAAPDGFDVEETGVTLLQNAWIKAAALRGEIADDAWVVADDSGLVVHALGGRPGVFSARYAGPDATYADNCRRLLDEMEGLEDRSAAFVCVLVGLDAHGDMRVACGTVSGTIAPAMRGGEGFGYDPVFVPEGLDVTSAELAPDEKDARSHRGQAFAALVPVLAEVLRAR